jgi:hypothetical protein
MDDATKAFVERENVVRYIDQLKTETDVAKRDMLSRLLAEAAAKQVKAPTR